MATPQTKPEVNKETVDDRIKMIETERERVKLGGGEDRIKKQHEGGKLTARERVERLIDPGSFQEVGLFAKHRCTNFDMTGKDVPADGVVTGCGKIDGRRMTLRTSYGTFVSAGTM